MSRFSNDAPNPPFRPALSGCVAQDRHLARAVGETYQWGMYLIAAYLWRSVMSETRDSALSDLFDRCAKEEIEHFRLLGELASALGGAPRLYTQVRIDPARYGAPTETGFLTRLVREAICEEKQMIDRLQTLMGRTCDRVVRSVLSQMISDEHRRVERLSGEIF